MQSTINNAKNAMRFVQCLWFDLHSVLKEKKEHKRNQNCLKNVEKM